MIRIGTWNVLGLQGFRAVDMAADFGPAGGPQSLARWVDAFSTLDCDALAIQEGVPHDWMREVAAMGGWHVATIPSPQSWPGHVLSRHPIVETRVYSHAGPGVTREHPFSRCLGASRIAVPGIGAIWLVVLHAFPDRPQTPEQESRRLREIEAGVLDQALVALAGDGAHLVVCGDFNSEPSEPLHQRLLEQGFVNAMTWAGGVQPTFGKQGERPDHFRSLDHIYLPPALASRLAGARVVRDEGFWYPGPERPGLWALSDHLPVVAELADDVSAGASA